jgi:hypothetical protein
MDLILVPLEERPIDHPLAASFMHPSHAGRRVQVGLNRGFRPRHCEGFAFKSFAMMLCGGCNRDGGFFMGAN